MKQRIHFTANSLIRPNHPVTVHLVGAGGTGSQVLTSLARINYSLVALGHPGLMLYLFDDDTVTSANPGRQLFAVSEKGSYKAEVLINRVNRFFGTGWKAIAKRYNQSLFEGKDVIAKAAFTISCVDTVQSRFDIAAMLKMTRNTNNIDGPLYWMDFGNNLNTGQVILATVGAIPQPASKKLKPVATLPFVTEEFKLQLTQDQVDEGPSCSLAEALTRQDLFINSALSQMGASLLWNMLRSGTTAYRGFFLNLKDFRSQPLLV